MANPFIVLTRVDPGPGGTSVLVNLGNVAWIEPAADGTSRVVFAVGLTDPREATMPISIVVRESTKDIALLAGAVQTTDREAIAQAWVDQRGRRGMSDEET
jgi:hypothetical protein